jgi:hypothetical protein
MKNLERKAWMSLEKPSFRILVNVLFLSLVFKFFLEYLEDEKLTVMIATPSIHYTMVSILRKGIYISIYIYDNYN